VASVYSKLLFSGGTPGGAVVPPAGTVWVVKDISCFNSSGVPGDVEIALAGPTPGVFYHHLFAGGAALELDVQYGRYVVCPPGDGLDMVSVMGVLWCVCGYELTLP
jgi:hypothetical protein